MMARKYAISGSDTLGMTHALYPSMATRNTDSVTYEYRRILQNLVCDRFFGRDAALMQLDIAVERRLVDIPQARRLEAAIELHYAGSL